jgi:hypothetical protein
MFGKNGVDSHPRTQFDAVSNLLQTNVKSHELKNLLREQRDTEVSVVKLRGELRSEISENREKLLKDTDNITATVNSLGFRARVETPGLIDERHIILKLLIQLTTCVALDTRIRSRLVQFEEV